VQAVWYRFNYLPPVSVTQVVLVVKFATSVNDTKRWQDGGKFASSVVDTGGAP